MTSKKLTPNTPEQEDEVDPRFVEVLELFVEAAHNWVEPPNNGIDRADMHRLLKLRSDLAYRRRKRQERMHDELRLCPSCGGLFPVSVHARPGRVKTYCSKRCRIHARLARGSGGGGGSKSFSFFTENADERQGESEKVQSKPAENPASVDGITLEQLAELMGMGTTRDG